jgi:hypothetical protein
MFWGANLEEPSLPQLLFACYLVLTAVVFARLEIQIEGPNGWAAQLPTWRIQNRWTRLFYGSRPLTGYHLWMLIFVLAMIHAPVALKPSIFSGGLELRIISFCILFFLVEDFLWFVLNPAFGIRRFRREHIWWHAPSWWWVMPRDYWVYGTIGLFAYAVSWHI